MEDEEDDEDGKATQNHADYGDGFDHEAYAYFGDDISFDEDPGGFDDYGSKGKGKGKCKEDDTALSRVWARPLTTTTASTTIAARASSTEGAWTWILADNHADFGDDSDHADHADFGNDNSFDDDHDGFDDFGSKGKGQGKCKEEATALSWVWARLTTTTTVLTTTAAGACPWAWEFPRKASATTAARTCPTCPSPPAAVEPPPSPRRAA
eukprot:CAMPEP_0203949808 /NCGR_PEP_ID=MMETSP0359-20131031/84128_1 /ASSEMBLY_ACC=CAM_ASM_000338 /TAXON_ID=268821 /ORGANISM="Scrippsiella Hangoei, Strain SHTV-5" /LENGTH=209 /DNA_ID=CAMNT_0050881851 /DNA_START=63 /DNA_END=688 /DNA_ORIENTATION=-